jgi:hypothetical protein
MSASKAILRSSKRLGGNEIAGFEEDSDAFDDEDLFSLDSSDFVFVGSGSTPKTIESDTLAAKGLPIISKAVGRSGWDDTSVDLRTQNVPPRSIVEAASLRHRQKAARMQQAASSTPSHNTHPQPITRAEVHSTIPTLIICRFVNSDISETAHNLMRHRPCIL